LMKLHLYFATKENVIYYSAADADASAAAVSSSASTIASDPNTPSAPPN